MRYGILLTSVAIAILLIEGDATRQAQECRGQSACQSTFLAQSPSHMRRSPPLDQLQMFPLGTGWGTDWHRARTQIRRTVRALQQRDRY
jgi:hypothetical protein